MLKMLALTLTATLALLGTASDLCSCCTTTSTIVPEGCARTVKAPVTKTCGDISTATVTVPAADALCAATSTIIEAASCGSEDNMCPIATATVTTSCACDPTTTVKPTATSTTATTWSTITLSPHTDKAELKRGLADGGYVTQIPGGLAHETICPPTTTVCSVCVGCNAPVTVCRAQ